MPLLRGIFFFHISHGLFQVNKSAGTICQREVQRTGEQLWAGGKTDVFEVATGAWLAPVIRRNREALLVTRQKRPVSCLESGTEWRTR